MHSSQVDQEILRNADFHRLVAARRRVSWSLLLVLLLVFGLLSVHFPAFLAMTPFRDGIVPMGIFLGYAILALTFVFMLVYVWIANSYLEPLEKKVLADLSLQAPGPARSKPDRGQD